MRPIMFIEVPTKEASTRRMLVMNYQTNPKGEIICLVKVLTSIFEIPGIEEAVGGAIMQAHSGRDNPLSIINGLRKYI